MIRFGGLKLFTPFKTFKRWNSPQRVLNNLNGLNFFEPSW